MTCESRLFLIALQFLTRVPVPSRVGFELVWLPECLRQFPLVGACVGAWAPTVFGLALLLWPPLVASAAVSLVATVWLTGAFHEDGLADTCDALGGTVSRERALAIMKDSRIGSYGAVALGLALVRKVTAMAGLASSTQTDGPAWAAMALIGSHTVSRAAPVWLVWRVPHASSAEHSKAKPLAARLSGSGLAVALVWVGAVSGATVWVTARIGASSWTAALWVALSALAACALTTLCYARWLYCHLRGITGDTLGATQQIVELAGLLTWLAWLPFIGGNHA